MTTLPFDCVKTCSQAGPLRQMLTSLSASQPASIPSVRLSSCLFYCPQPRQPTGFSAFVKEHFEATRQECGGAGTPHKTVMGRLAQQWALHKATVAMTSVNISEQPSGS